MKLLNHRVLYSILFYVLIICLVIVAKPPYIFDIDGSVKPFGLGEKNTIFSLGVFVVTLAIISFYLFAVIDVVFGK
jgi:hypothetical protein